jgi:Tfp pilus assembly protein PilN
MLPTQKKDLTAQISALEQALASTEAARQAFIAALDSINSGGDRIDGDLRATVNNVVTYLNLSGINHSGNGLAINGVAPSEVEVLAYARNLKASGRFDEVTITNIKRVEGRGGGVEGGGEGEVIEGSNDEDVSVQFSLTLRLKAAK